MNLYTWENIQLPSTPNTIYKLEVKSHSLQEHDQRVTAACTSKLLPAPLQAEFLSGISRATTATPILCNHLDIVPSVIVYARQLPESTYHVLTQIL
jgi:hypothetical protein